VALPLQGPPPGPVTALALQGRALWAGTFDQGLGLLARGRWHRPRIFDDRITSLVVGPSGRLWVGTASGLAVQRTGARGFERVKDEPGWLRRHVSALRRQDEWIWAAVWPGLVAIDARSDPPRMLHFGATGHEHDAGLVGPTVYGLAFTGTGLWIGTDDGLGLLEGSGARGVTDLGGELPDNWINDVRAHREVVHLLTLRSGLLRIDQGGTRVVHTALMTSPSVLLPLDGGVLFGTNAAGLAALRGGAIRTFGPAEGLASTMVTALAHDPMTDRLWIGGNAGIDRVDGARRAFDLELGDKEGP
jgi:ligand-binding sensor domain-containing protein